jgi:hypothetical protein
MSFSPEDRPIWLKTLAQADCQASMPASGEAKLVTAYRARKRAARMRQVATFAAAAALAGVLWIPLQHRPAVAEYDDDDSQALLADAMAAAAGSGDSSGDNGFVPTLYASSGQPIESLRLVRVSIPKESLAQYGVRPPDVQSDEVAADLLVGQDGIARAIRVSK